METFNSGTTFQFSGASIDELVDFQYSLVTLIVDRSGSTAGFQSEMEACVKNVVESCQHSPHANNLLLRVLSFDNHVTELHGFKLLSDCNLDDYNGFLNPGGMTALRDATLDGIEAMSTYAKNMVEMDNSVNGICIVITDGYGNVDRSVSGSVKKALKNCITDERLESINSILVGVNAVDYRVPLNEFQQDEEISQYVELGDADPKTLAKLAQFVSHSISSTSQALGSGGPSQALTF